MTIRTRTLPLLLSLMIVGAAGCGGGGQADTAKAAAEQKAADAKKAEEEAIAKRKAEREAKAKAEADAKAAEEAKVDAICVLPEKYEKKKINKACDAMVKAYDEYMRKVLTGDMLTKWETGGNAMQMGMYRKECVKKPIEVAACQLNAFKTATPEMKKDLPRFNSTCAKKFGGGDAKAGGPPPKK